MFKREKKQEAPVMSAELEAAVKNFTETRTEYIALQSKNQSCKDNSGSYYDRKDQLGARVSKLEQGRKDLIEGIANGDGNESDLLELNKTLRELKAELSEAEELYDAAQAGIERTGKELAELNRGYYRSRREAIWRCVANAEIERAAEIALPIIFKAFIAHRNTGVPTNFLDFIKEKMNTVRFEARHWSEQQKELANGMEQEMIESYRLPFD